MKAVKILIWLNAGVFLLYGLGFIFFPEALSLWVTDAFPASTSGMIDMRATYGGLALGFGLLLAYSTRKSNDLRLGLWAVILAVGGMAFGRIVGIFVDGSPNTMMYIYLALEILVVAIGLFLARKHFS